MSCVWGSALRSSSLLRWASLCAALLLCAPHGASAAVYQSVEQALKIAFPDAERFEKQSAVLTDTQKRRVEELAKAPVDSALATVNVAWKGAEVLGYAFVDVHTVRTVQQGLMVVVTPDGHVKSVRVLAFYEPPEYLPNDRFRVQYEGRALDDNLQLKQGIETVAGSTLSSVATTRAVRRSLALWDVLVAAKPSGTGAGSGAQAPASGAPVVGAEAAPAAVGAGK
jgi:hypothetical protein